jgi:N6-L-threonylcarbamoyladenine synthase
MLKSGDFDFSFSGLKTAVLTAVRNGADTPADLAAEFQEAVTEVLASKSLAAVRACGLSRLVVAGGVGANTRLRERLNEMAAKHKIRVYYPEVALCTDNGAMIAFCGAQRLLKQMATKRDGAFAIRPRWPLDQINTPL